MSLERSVDCRLTLPDVPPAHRHDIGDRMVLIEHHQIGISTHFDLPFAGETKETGNIAGEGRQDGLQLVPTLEQGEQSGRQG